MLTPSPLANVSYPWVEVVAPANVVAGAGGSPRRPATVLLSSSSGGGRSVEAPGRLSVRSGSTPQPVASASASRAPVIRRIRIHLGKRCACGAARYGAGLGRRTRAAVVGSTRPLVG